MSGAIVRGRDVVADMDVACDVCVVGSGAGGAVLAAGLCARGLRVVMLEEGGSYTKADFDLHERHAYPALYQERGARATADLAITILQGRSVGGGTTVNWTTCFRTPDRVLDHWRRAYGVEGLDPDTLRPHFEAVEARLGIHEWPVERANANNRALWDGARALGWDATPLRRNVRGCVDSGYCGLGCPVDAKQAMHLTYVRDAVGAGLVLYADTRAERLVVERDRVVAVTGVVLDRDNDRPTGRRVVVRPKIAVASGGAINTPALLLRSGLNPNGRVGQRTFLHPVVAVSALYDREIRGYWGAPQSVGSHRFAERGDDKVGFFLETAPVQPMLAATALPGHGRRRWEAMSQLPHVGTIIGLCIDGFLAGDDGGAVSLRGDGRVRVDYPIGPALAEAMREATITIARIELAAGARLVRSLHADPIDVTGPDDLEALARAAYGAHAHSIFSAHQMGGAAMGADAATSVVRADHRHHVVPNLYVVDGSVFPTSLGVNPSETIYALAHRAVDLVAAAV